jgi:hypothetical protein
MEIVAALGHKKVGMTRQEIIDATGKNQGGKLTKILEELEECDFIRSYSSIGKQKKDTVYQLIDNYTLFYYKFIADQKINDTDYWNKIISKTVYNVWSGLAFERVCFWHIEQIKQALGISGVISNVFSWIYKPENASESGVQIDMLIDRDDNVINLCEIKFSNSEYEITEKYEKELRRKADVFKEKSKTQKGVTTVMITANGLKRNQWANSIQRQISADDLFV